MKKLIFVWVLNLVFATMVWAQVSTQDSNWHGPGSNYHLPSFPGWSEERFPIPIGFAPSIPLKGVEDIRFSPGWAKPQNQQFWTYAFLWYLEGSPKISEDSLERYLMAYYSGLYLANTWGDSVRLLDRVSVVANIKASSVSDGSVASFSGEIRMNDYMEKKPITLRIKIHQKPCLDGKMAFFFELSPKPFSDRVWKSLDQLWVDFDCNKAVDKKGK